ncbi:hypothetical protein [Paenibacillus sp. P3E]|uniref:hypothetical protein n=1 Tax=Paenibacillus sp. P3E TaxID=1349435 RepID=UPI000AD0E233|nr:hypothetical protein [Paenibacillus sp. P3E]
MGRKQAFTKSELLDQTKQLLLQHGYEGFQLKLLSQNLVGARSYIKWAGYIEAVRQPTIGHPVA